jgi:hypothetical protein
MDVHLGLESEEHAAREADGLTLVRRRHLTITRRPDDAPHRGTSRDEVAHGAHEMQHAGLGDDPTKGACAHAGGDERRQP